MENIKKYNGLQNENSIYLLQHSEDRVNWSSFGPDALQRAKNENKPIFLSIGYSSCHWCHIMADESFRDEKVAEFVNDNFIPILVDKEELPDLDQYYQLACQVMNGRGGWPLNAFLTPDMKPFFVGTYFPKTNKNGTPSFLEVIGHISKDFRENREKIDENAHQIVETLKSPPKVEHKVDFEGHFPNAASILNALKEYKDDDHGGYGVDPKFPHYSFLEWSVEHMLEGMIPEEFTQHIIKSVDAILMGGLYDHARGGVHRYASDKAWANPHFEKMLYDQAGLLKVLSKVSLIYPSPLVFDSLIQTMDYLYNEMLSEKGYFFSAQDSDSEGVEGLYFTFSKDEFVDAVISFDETLTDQMDKILSWFGITEEGNFDHKLNTIRLERAKAEEFFTPEGWDTVRKVRTALLENRKMRIPPLTDNKGVGSWNFMVLTSLIDVIQYCKIESIKKSAVEIYQSTYNRISENFLTTGDGQRSQLKTTTTRDTHVAQFEDYVAFMEFCFRSYELFADSNFLENAKQSVEYIFKEFHKDGVFHTRALSQSDVLEYDNIHTPLFDQSYKAPLPVLISHLRKWSLHIPEFKDYLKKMDSVIENITHLSLQSPLNFGETLRALTYPDEAYKKIEVPLKWKSDAKFTQFYINFSFRFAIVYKETDEDKWQISNINEVELQGSTLEEFSKVFLPPENES